MTEELIREQWEKFETVVDFGGVALDSFRWAETCAP